MAEEEEEERATRVRVFVGGLGASVSEDDLGRMMGALGRVHSVEMVRSKERDFAYVEFEAVSAAALSKLFSTYNGCKWKGGRLRVEKAKEHYLLRLQCELAAEAKSVPDAGNIKIEKINGQTKRTTQSKGLKIYFPKTKKVKLVSDKGLGKHKRSFQRVESLPLCLLSACSCEEHKEIEDASHKTDILLQYEFERNARVMEQLESRWDSSKKSQRPDICIAEAKIHVGSDNHTYEMPRGTFYLPSTDQPQVLQAETDGKANMISGSRQLLKSGKDVSARSSKKTLNLHSRVDNENGKLFKHAIECPTQLASVNTVPEGNKKNLGKIWEKHTSEFSTQSPSLSAVPEGYRKDLAKSRNIIDNPGTKRPASCNIWEKAFKAAAGTNVASSYNVQGAALQLSDDDQMQDFSGDHHEEKRLGDIDISETAKCMDAEENVTDTLLLNTRGSVIMENTLASKVANEKPDIDWTETGALAKMDPPESKNLAFSQKESETEETLVQEPTNKGLGDGSKWVQRASWKSLVGDTGVVAFSLRSIIYSSNLLQSLSENADSQMINIRTKSQPPTCDSEPQMEASLFEAAMPCSSSRAVERRSTVKKNSADTRQLGKYLAKGGDDEMQARVTQTKSELQKLGTEFPKKAQSVEKLEDASNKFNRALSWRTDHEIQRPESETHLVAQMEEVPEVSPPLKDLPGSQICSFMRSPNAEQEWLALKAELKVDYKGKHKAAMRRMNKMRPSRF
ncbi:hypothetical protein O6H91_01G126200 [Diphasiastrum complanatum]|uniref:Uncharacterized protein n=4 Tax=Diphasiastrum complanatum TaxID=34168 RepID=A0ACC2EVN1_DIPCM|nr:hypothetical protein O6H91_01G126200 [Diphasiastrum complanatum]KAJ7570567.1 hypothetical protein O6H91_01G126200 [Diphasiastrum complanatum]KAJ7570568.1 hypothetical protein O6H91_01G126200 [Diphasiastrum complanatum]KAJ7570569.1 hypothetical protein O6H91_01G126200 [Diphasiastrum complanatum]